MSVYTQTVYKLQKGTRYRVTKFLHKSMNYGSHSEIAYKMVEALVLIFCSPQLVVAFLHPGFRVLVEPGLAQWFVD